MWNALTQKVTRLIFDKAINQVGAMSASVGNELSHHAVLIQRFHALRLAQSYVTVANQIVYAAIAT